MINIISRLPNSKESALWRKAQKIAGNVADSLIALRLLGSNAAAAHFWATQNGLSMPPPAELEQRVLELESAFEKVRHKMRAVEDLKLGLMYRAGDIDIVVPQGSENLEGIVLIAIGVIAVAGLVAGLIYYRDQARDTIPKYNALLAATDKQFCQHESPETCEKWKKFKIESGYSERAGIADKIVAGLGQVAGVAGKGAGVGLAIAIPLAIGLLAWNKKR